MSFIVIEGLDGSGKSTQIRMLREYLLNKEISFKYLHFPRLEHGMYGKLIARFLRGEMGDIAQVDPYLVAMIFAGDRWEAAQMIREWIQQGCFVLIDRYVYSNIAFQCAKYQDASEQKKLQDWILQLEFEQYNLPVPDMNIFLDVPFEFTRKRLSEERNGLDREYLKGQKDIHEKDIDFQGKVRQMYFSMLEEIDNIRIVDCADDRGEMLPPEHIFSKIQILIQDIH